MALQTRLEQERTLVLMDTGEVEEKLALPSGLKAEVINIGRKPKIHPTAGGYAVKINANREFLIGNRDALDDLIGLTGIPKRLVKDSPEKLILPLVEYHLPALEKVVAVSDDIGLRSIHLGGAHPPMATGTTLAMLKEQFPEVLYQQAAMDTDYNVDLLAITKNDVSRLEMLVQPGQHKSLPKGGDPFRSGVHLRYSPLGVSSPLIEPYLVRLVCTNGAIHAEYLSDWGGRGLGEGDELWQWFREGMATADGAIQKVMGQYAGLVGEELSGNARPLAVEGAIRTMRLPPASAAALRDLAIANPPHSMYDMFNLLTQIATHYSKNVPEQMSRMRQAGAQATPGQHEKWCPTCHRN